jgi:very-short-patch-repair endonuclease
MPTDLPPLARELAQFQRGVLTRKQALACGVSTDTIRSRVRYQRWQQLYRGVYAVFPGSLPRDSLLWAAVLRAGPGAMLSHQTAGEVSGLIDEPSALIHVTVPGNRRVSKLPGHVMHFCTAAGLARHPSLTPPRTRVEETVLDLTQAAVTFDAAYGWVTRAVGRRLTTPARLREAAESRSRLRWRVQLARALGPDFDGIHSGLEYRYLRDAERAHRLPWAARQVRVRRGTRVEYRDALYQAFGVAVELDGQAAHPGDLRWRDIRRDNAALADGIITLRYGWTDVTERPCQVAAQVAGVLRQRGWTGSARPCGRPGCSVAMIS